ncbi:MAG: glycosyltransferase [Bacteroidetes bacterium]|nr:MAG: glycosyltransferase [Bacteroidota bacterium]
MKILFVAPLKSTFVKNDIFILSTQHKLLLENSDIGRGFNGLINLIKIIFRSLFRIFIVDAVFCWFGDYASLFPTLFGKLFGKKVYVIAGGFDVSYIPQLNYGARARAFRWFCARNSFRFATTVLPVSNFAEKCLNERMKGKVKKSVVVYNCIDVEKLSSYKKEIERNIILTISRADDYIEYILKGTDRFINIARKMPHRQFVIAGLQSQALELARKEAGDMPNLKIIPGFLSLYDEIIPLYNQASAYVQLSLEESFGISVAEAMVFGCAPIITNKGGLSEVAGDKGIIVETDDDVINAIEHSFQYSQEQRQELLEQTRNFDIKNRKKSLYSIIK